MIRKLSLSLLAAAIIVSACGRQVTPDRVNGGQGGLSSGFMQIKFRTQSPLDFTNVRYVVTFNTTGTGGTPYAANAGSTNYQNYSFQFVVGGNGGVLNVALYQYVVQQQGQPPVPRLLNYLPTQLQFNQNSNGQNTEFTITFDRSLFYGLLTPAPTATPTPSPTPTPTPSGATPSPTPAGTPTPATTPSPPFSNVWYWNFFTTQAAPPNQTLDAFSVTGNGPNDVSFQGGPLDISQSFDRVYNVVASPQITPASAQIVGAEFINAP